MNNIHAAHAAPRCKATSKRTRQPCKAPAVRGWSVCRFHGAHGGGPKGKANGAYRHGRYTREALAMRRALSVLLRESRATLATINGDKA